MGHSKRDDFSNLTFHTILAGRKSSSRMSRAEIKSARSHHLGQIRSFQKEIEEEEERKKLVSENRLRARELLENHRKNRVYQELVSSRVNRRFFTSEKKATNEKKIYEIDEVQKLDFFKSKSTL